MIGASVSLRAADGSPLVRARHWSRAEWIAAAANVLAACAIVFLFHDRFWWAPDDGTYAYVADRLLNGAVLNRDVQDVHAGYVHFLHAFSLEIFGRDIVSLRYLLAFLTIVQSSVIFFVLRPLVGPAALAGGLAMSALTFVQFLNPTANWYALFFCILLIAMLAAHLERGRSGLVAIGALIGLLFLFRQLSGVLVAMGVVAYLLLPENDAPRRTGGFVLARSAAVLMAGTLALYLWLKADAAAFALFGIWPLVALVFVGVRTRLDDAAMLRLAGLLSAGAFLACLPLILYHFAHGSVGIWLDDAFLSAFSLAELEFFRARSYANLLFFALTTTATFASPAAALNGLFWLLLLVAPFALGLQVVRAIRLDAVRVHPLPFIAVFYALVSVHYAIPIYLMYSAALTLAAMIAIVRAPAARTLAETAIVLAVIVGLVFHAAQPLSRGLGGTMRGDRVALEAAGLAGASIRIDRADRATYTRLLRFIDANASREESIFALPMSPELYFLSGRTPPVRYPIAPLALRSEHDVERSLAQLAATVPAVIIFKPNDKYTTPRVRELMDRLRPDYRACGTIGAFELYARRPCN